MNKTLSIGLAIFGLVANLSCYAAVSTVELKNPKDIQDAMVMQNAITHLNSKAIVCIDKKLAPMAECSCLYPNELSQAKQAFKNTIKLHPSWEDKNIFWVIDGSPHSTFYNISFVGYKRKFEQKCPTPPSSGTPNGTP